MVSSQSLMMSMGLVLKGSSNNVSFSHGWSLDTYGVRRINQNAPGNLRWEIEHASHGGMYGCHCGNLFRYEAVSEAEVSILYMSVSFPSISITSGFPGLPLSQTHHGPFLLCTLQTDVCVLSLRLSLSTLISITIIINLNTSLNRVVLQNVCRPIV